MERLVTLQDHLKKNPLSKCPDDVVICASVRTPLTRAKKGEMRDTPAEIML
jgi:acetyl-CoA acyltransferase 1